MGNILMYNTQSGNLPFNIKGDNLKKINSKMKINKHQENILLIARN